MNSSTEPESFSDADEVDDDPPSGGREDERVLFDTEWAEGEESEDESASNKFMVTDPELGM